MRYGFIEQKLSLLDFLTIHFIMILFRKDRFYYFLLPLLQKGSDVVVVFLFELAEYIIEIGWLGFHFATTIQYFMQFYTKMSKLINN